LPDLVRGEEVEELKVERKRKAKNYTEVAEFAEKRNPDREERGSKTQAM